ncbi:MAG: metallophosphoesterase [Oscillospiraceae bacterium]|nr:metallophosphoesterase [Oscillospiraceae bacterium]
MGDESKAPKASGASKAPGARRVKREGRGRRVIALLLLIVIAIAALLFDSNTRLVTTQYKLAYPNLPPSFDGYKIAVISDTHASEFGKNNERLVSMVTEAQPDIIALLGDMIDHDPKPPLEEQLQIAEALVAQLVPIAPVYYITGNHEWDSGGVWQLLDMLDSKGVKILRNSYVLLEAGGENVVLAGADDPNGPSDMMKPGELVERIAASEAGRFIIMLEHRNNRLQLYSELGVDLLLCGHAHGGLIRLPFTDGLIGPSRDWFPTYTSGVYSMGSTNMVVSRGIGNHTGWPRLFNNPQMVVVELGAH